VEEDIATSELFNQGKEFDVKRQIVGKLLDSTDLETKTELDKPLRWAGLATVQNFIENNNLPKTAKLLSFFMQNAYLMLISKCRKGRSEYIEALKALSNENPIDSPVSPLNTLPQ
jgi:hypothetical protein